MDPKPPPSGSGGALAIIIILIVVWVVNGGPTKERSKRATSTPTEIQARDETIQAETVMDENQPSKPATTADIAEELDRVREEVKRLEAAIKEAHERAIASPYQGVVTLEQASARRKTPSDEYLRIRVSKKAASRVPLTGWRLKSVMTTKSIAVGKGAYLPNQGTVSEESHIFLEPGALAVLVTGRSPIGPSFRMNLCSGFFEQFQNFTPSLPLECPSIPYSTLPPPEEWLTLGYTDACMDYLERFPKCTIPVSQPSNLTNICKNFALKHFNYSDCVLRAVGTQTDFYKNEWRIFLGRDEELWKEKREVIQLLDIDGKLVDMISY